MTKLGRYSLCFGFYFLGLGLMVMPGEIPPLVPLTVGFAMGVTYMWASR